MVIHDTECPYWDQVLLTNTKPTLLPLSNPSFSYFKQKPPHSHWNKSPITQWYYKSQICITKCYMHNIWQFRQGEKFRVNCERQPIRGTFIPARHSTQRSMSHKMQDFFVHQKWQLIRRAFMHAHVIQHKMAWEGLHNQKTTTWAIILVNSYSASHDNWCTVTLWKRTMTAQCEGMGEVGSARYEPALLPPCPSIRVLSYSNCQEIHSRQ